MATLHSDDNDPTSLPVVRIKLPWTFLIAAFGGGMLTLVMMYSSVNRLTDEVRDLKTVVQAGNMLVSGLQVDVGVLKQQTVDTKVRLERHLENPNRREN